MTDFTRTDYGVEAPARFTIEEFQQLCDTGIFQGSRLELAEGIIVRAAAPFAPLAWLRHQLANDLNEVFDGSSDGRTALFSATVQFGDRTLRVLNLAVVRAMAVIDRYFVPEDVLLAVEISSVTLRYDLDRKRTEYARGGIAHYWVVDVAGECVHVMGDPIDGDYTARRRVPFGEPLAVPGSDGTVNIR